MADQIKHVVVLMLENRSFDQMLGALKAVYPELDGVEPANPRTNRVTDTEVYSQAETRTLRFEPDPKHELKNVLRQIDKLSELPVPRIISCWRWILEWIWNLLLIVLSYLAQKFAPVRKAAVVAPYEGKFVLDYAIEYPESTVKQRQEIMGYYPLNFLPALHALAQEFTVCDHWHSSVPGPTWANRFFLHSGTALGRVWMPEHAEDLKNTQFRPYGQTTVYERLSEKGKKWRIYFGDIPQSFALVRQLHSENIRGYRPMTRFFEDANGPESDFPDYCVIEPAYFRTNGNDDHPPHNTMHAQCLIADVYNALRKNPDLWKSTLFVILYDEHGGFFDHVEPDRTGPPDDHDDEYTFDRLGVRVPALLVSPWVKKGVLPKQFDHTSLLKYISDKWQLGPLGKRVEKANSIAEALTNTARLDVLPEIRDSKEMADARKEPTLADPEKNGNQIYLLILSAFLATLLDAESLAAQLPVSPETVRPDEPSDEVTAAKITVDRLVRQEAAKAGP